MSCCSLVPRIRLFFFFSSRRRHTRLTCDWSSDVCSSHLMTGYAAVVLLSIYLGGTIVLQDVWEPRHGVSLMVREGVTYTAASTPFLNDICDVVTGGAPRPASLRSFLCAGATIPPVLIERAAREVGIHACSLWGMTESLASTLTEPSRAAEKSPTTDGRPLEGMEV